MENQAKIAKALVAAQKAFGPALKTTTNTFFKSRYAALDACIEAVVDALNDNGVFLLQKNHPYEQGVAVETVFLHESGESLSSGILEVPAGKRDPQGYGSALTYARRYSLMAACGMAPEDDDGNAGTKATPATVMDPAKVASFRACKTGAELYDLFMGLTPHDKSLYGPIKDEMKAKLDEVAK